MPPPAELVAFVLVLIDAILPDALGTILPVRGGTCCVEAVAEFSAMTARVFGPTAP